jgi:hypothetical protein
VSWADLPTSGLLGGDVAAPRRIPRYSAPTAINEGYTDAPWYRHGPPDGTFSA